MDRTNLPLIAPQYEPRYISAKDVLALLSHGKVAGVNYEDPRIQEIRSCTLGVAGETDLRAALKAGYMHDRGIAMHDARDSILTAWRWWCTAAGHPHIVLASDGIGLYQVTCDLVSTGRTWLITDVPHYQRILGEVTTVYRADCRFSVDDRVFKVTGVEMDDAISIARNLVEYTTTGSFKQRQGDQLPAPDPLGQLVRPLVPMERSDSL